MIRQIFTKQINSITIAALLVALSSLVSRILGMLRDRIFASEFGLGDTLDIYYAAFRIPDFIFNLLVLGALSAGFVPLFTGLLKKTQSRELTYEKNQEAWQFANSLLNILSLVLFALSVIGFLSAPYLMKILAPGFSAQKLELSADLTRIMFLSPFLLGLSSIFGGALQSFKRFFAYSLSPIFYNVGIIVGAIYFVPLDNSFGGVKGLAWGVVLGAFLHLLTGLLVSIRLGYRYRFLVDWRDQHIVKIFNLMIPRTLSLAVTQLNLLAITIIASTLASGSLTVFNLANNLQSFPVGIFGLSFAVAAFPAFSANAFNRKKLTASFSSVFRQIIFFILPATVLFIALRAQLIRLVLGAGLFGWEDTLLTIDVFSYFLLSLFAQASIPLLVRVYYARQNTIKPFVLGLVSVLVNVILSLFLAGRLGIAGLALAFSISSIINFVLLWLFLHFELGGLDEKRTIRSVFKISLAAAGCGVIVQSSERVLSLLVDMEKFWGVLVHASVSGVLGLAAYFLICAALKSEEFNDFWQSIKRRLPFKKIQTGDHGEARGI